MTKSQIFHVLDRLHAQIMEDGIHDAIDVIELLYEEFESEFDNEDTWG